MPQPRNTRPPAPEAPTPASPKPGEHNPFVHSLLEQAKMLDEQKEKVYEQIGANRDLLRNVKITGLLSAEQAKAVDEFYPLRKKNSTTVNEAVANLATTPAPPATPAA